MTIRRDYALSIEGEDIYLDLNSLPYMVQRFLPPTSREVAIFSPGSSSNRYDGERMLGTRAQNAGINFSVLIIGDGETEIRDAVAALQHAINLAKEREIYLVYRGSRWLSREPIWGQWGAGRRYRIAQGSLIYNRNDTARTGALPVAVQLTVKPYSEGRRQRLAIATGGVFHDTVGIQNGRPRGVIVPPASTNFFHNPINCCRDADSYRGWSVSHAALEFSEISDPADILFAGYSIRLYNGDAAVSRQWKQSVNVGTTATHALTAFVKKSDKSAVTSDDCVLYYNAELTTTFTEMGNGWYRLHATFTGIASGVNAGLSVKLSREVIVHGLTLEAKYYSTYIVSGSHPGSAYSSADFAASTTTRTVGSLYIPAVNASDKKETFHRAKGTVVIAWKSYASKAELVAGGAHVYVFDGTNHSVYIYWSYLDYKWYAHAGGVTISGVARDVVDSEILVFHFVYGPSGLFLYINGELYASGAAPTMSTTPTNLYFGCTYTSAGQAASVIMAASFFDYEATADEIADDYSYHAPILDGDGAVSPIPYIQTKTAGLLESCFDSNKANYGTICGIMGDVPALTRYDISHSVGDCDVLLSLLPLRAHLHLGLTDGEYLLDDVGNNADASACGAFRLAANLDHYSDAALGLIPCWPLTADILNRDYIGWFRFKHDSAEDVTAYIRIKWSRDGATANYSDAKAWADYVDVATYTCIYSDPVRFPEFSRRDKLYGIAPDGLYWMVQLYETGVASPDCYLDHGGIFPRPLKIIKLGTTSDKRFVMQGSDVRSGQGGQPSISGFGDDLSLIPDRVNYILAVSAAYTDADADSFGYTLTFNSIDYTPRFLIA